jgi:outer membrane protein
MYPISIGKDTRKRRMIRMNRIQTATLLYLIALSTLIRAQEPLSLQDAVRLALEQNPAIQVSAAAAKIAEQRVEQTRAGYWPDVNYTESFQYGNNPVYVFGSLLEQHQFSSSNFDLGTLNRPDPLTNFSSQLTISETLFNGNKTRNQVQAAHLAVNIANEQGRQSEMDILLEVVDAYYTALLAQEGVKVSEEAYQTAQADLDRARSLREAEMTTESDELALQVRLSEVEDQRIRTRNDIQVSLARLNNVLAVPLDTPHNLTSPLRPAPNLPSPLEQYEEEAVSQRPEAQQAQTAVKMAEIDRQLSRAAFLPEVKAQSAFAANRRTFASQGGTDWLAGASLKLNLFNGFADRSRIAETALLKTQREQEWQRIQSALRLQVRQAFLNFNSANSRIETAQSAVAAAEEGHRIVANRYEAQLSTATDLLRSQSALSAAKQRYLSAVYDQRIAAARLERAAGTLSSSSDVLNP